MQPFAVAIIAPMQFRWLAEVVPVRLRLALGVFVLVIAGGTVGYLLLTPMSLVDAIYQTVTTLSTVGFREVTPFDTRTKLFTVNSHPGRGGDGAVYPDARNRTDTRR